jgi:hypothetical protein
MSRAQVFARLDKIVDQLWMLGDESGQDPRPAVEALWRNWGFKIVKCSSCGGDIAEEIADRVGREVFCYRPACRKAKRSAFL